MKNIVLKILLLAFVSCNSELDVIVQDTFDFKVTTEKKEISFINEEVNTSITIEPEQVVKGTKYYFSYNVSKGKGYYKLGDKKLNANDEYELNTLNTQLTFITEEIMDNEVLITVKNDNDLIKEKTLIYKAVDLNDFTVVISKNTENEVYYTENVNFEIEIKKLASELSQDLTYELISKKQSLEGKLLVNGSELKQEEKIAQLTEGKLSLDFLSFETGNLDLHFLIKASNGREHEVKVNYIIKATEIELKIVPSKTSNYIGFQTDFNIEVIKKGSENLLFDLSFNGSLGRLKNVDKTFLNGEYFGVMSRQYKMQYTGLESSQQPIEFTIKASNGNTQSVLVEFETKKSDFSFTIIPFSNANYVGEKTEFKLDLIHIGGGSNSYEMYFTGPKSEITFNNQKYTNLDVIPVVIGNSTLEFKGLEVSDEPINFVIKGSDGSTRSKTISFESKPTDFVIVVSGDNLKQYYQFDISLEVNVIPPDVKNQFITYKFYYETENLGDISITEHNTNQIISSGEYLDLGNYRNMRLSLSQSGNVEPRNGKLKLVFIDSNGVRKEKVINVEWIK